MRIAIRRGVNVPIKGAPRATVEQTEKVARVGMVGHDFGRMRAEILVQVGQKVSIGTPLFRDRARPRLVFGAAVSGEVATIEIGARRRLSTISIVPDSNDTSISHDIAPAATQSGLQALLLASGQWPALRQRPFDRIADPEAAPRALFVTAIDTAPHAPDPISIISGRAADFAKGLDALSTLVDAPIYVCQPDTDPLVIANDQLKVVRFAGPHPAGLVGTHISRLMPIGVQDVVWHIGYQDVIAIGHLVTTGTIDPLRKIALSGPGLRNPRIVAVPLGVDLHALVRADMMPGPKSILSGSALSGRESPFLGRYALQATVLDRPEVKSRHWLLDALSRAQKPSPFIPTQALEQALGIDAPVVPILRALSIGDAETALSLGCANLAEEDLALATYLAGGQTDFGHYLRAVLDELEMDA
jgi:Na+-transporting NADH:ubiquinone oxidoreductase subunit A